MDKLFEKQTENYEIGGALKGIPPMEKNCVKYDELVFLTLIDILPEDERKKVLFYISKLKTCYEEYNMSMERLKEFCEFLHKNPPKF